MTIKDAIIHANPIGDELDGFHSKHPLNPTDDDNERLRNTVIDLLLALQSLSAPRSLPSEHSKESFLSDLAALYISVISNNYETERIRPLLNAVYNKKPDSVIWDAAYDAVPESVTESTPPPRPLSLQQTPWMHNTGSLQNSSEHRSFMDTVLKEELGKLHIGLPNFFEAFFGGVSGLESIAQAVFNKCKEGDNPLFLEKSGWQGWPEGAKESDVLSWFAPLTSQFVDLAANNQPPSRPRRRLLAQPHKPLKGSTADRKLDVSFVDDQSAGANSKYYWAQILIPGELKSNPSADIASKTWYDLGRYAREVLAAQDSRRFVLGFTLCGSRMRLWEFDRLGGIASESFNVNEDGLQFVTAVLGFLWLDEEQLGFDPTIITHENKRYISINRNGCNERLIIDRMMKRTACIAGRATTCWEAHLDGDVSGIRYVIKDSWQYPERDEEGKLLQLATELGVVNVARCYHHETVMVGDQIDDINGNVRRHLDISEAKNYRPESPMPPPRTNGYRFSRTNLSSSVAGTKRSSSCTNAPPSKRTCSSSPVKGRKPPNRVHRRIILRDLGDPIYKASSPTKLLAALEECIEGYESLRSKAGLLQCDISPNNLMINEDENNPSWRAFLIDLDLAIMEHRETSSGARGKTGTRAFMAIGVLLGDESHSYMHDLESFFWVLFWICIHYDGPDEGKVIERFDRWNYMETEQLAEIKKGIIADERDFRKTVESNFTPCYKPLTSAINRLRRKVFPDGRRWRVPNSKLYAEMEEILKAAQDELA